MAYLQAVSGSVTLSSGNNITVTGGGPLSLGGTASFNLTGTTTNSVQLGNASGSLTSLALVNDGVLISSNTGIPSWLANSGTAGFVLTANSGAPPSWQAVSASGAVTTLTGNTGGALSPTAGNFNTLGTGSITIAGSGSTLTTQLTGLTANSVLYGLGTATIGLVASGTTGQVLQANTAAAPTYSTATYPSTTTVNQLLYSSSANVVGGVTAGNNGVLISSAAGIPSWLADGTTGQVLTATTGSPPTWTTITTTDLHVSRFIVSAGGAANGANFTTIASAITAAVAAGGNQTIFIQPGTYTENLTLAAGINLAAFSGDGYTPNVTILGTCTATFAGACTIMGIKLQTNSTPCLTVSGSAATQVYSKGCLIDANNNTAISYSSSSASSFIYFFECEGTIDTTGIAYFSHSAAGDLRLFGCYFQNNGLSSTASTVSGSAGALEIRGGYFNNAITTSGTAALEMANVEAHGALIINSTAPAGNNSITGCSIDGGTSSAISIGAGATVAIAGCVVASSNTNAITGSGTLIYSGLEFSSTSSTINVTNQTGGTLKGGVFQAPSAGFLGEQIRSVVLSSSAVSLTNLTATNIASISLTPGIWDASVMLEFSGGTTITERDIAITSTSATLPGTLGDNRMNNSQANQSVLLVIPQYRITLTATTTYYMVASSNYTGGTDTAFGRITATRVG